MHLCRTEAELRVYHFTLIFAVFAMMMFASVDLYEAGSETVQDKSLYDEALDRAADAAVKILAQVPGTTDIETRELAAKAFFDSLCASMDGIGETPVRRMLEMYVPIMAVVEKDGVYVNSNEEFEDENGLLFSQRIWSEKLMFADFDSEGNPALCGEGEKRSSILSEILEIYCSKHNGVARQNGIDYRFYFPSSDGGMFARTVGEYGFIAVFQGWPMTDSAGRTVNYCGFTHSGIEPGEQFYISTEAEYGEKLFYHRKECTLCPEDAVRYGTGAECAAAGAWPCPECAGGKIR